MHAMAAALLATTMLAAPAVHAQTRTPSGPAPSGQAPSGNATRSAPNLSDQKLDAAAAAITKVNRLSKDYKQKFDNAAPDDRERIVNEADAALEQAVKQSGLSVEEYNQIIDVALNDPATQSRILQRLQTMPDEE
jgi:hypothetical protein